MLIEDRFIELDWLKAIAQVGFPFFIILLKLRFLKY